MIPVEKGCTLVEAAATIDRSLDHGRRTEFYFTISRTLHPFGPATSTSSRSGGRKVSAYHGCQERASFGSLGDRMQSWAFAGKPSPTRRPPRHDHDEDVDG